MGYCIRVYKEDFKVAPGNLQKVEQILLDYGDRWALRCNMSPVEIAINPKKANWTLEFQGEKYWDEDDMFKDLGPLVKAGSFIEIVGEDGDRWRYFFDGERCIIQDPIITWKERKRL